MSSWTDTSPYLVNVRWQQVAHDLILDKRYEQHAVTVKLNGSNRNQKIYYDNMVLRQGLEFSTPYGQISMIALNSATVYLAPIVFTAPLRVSIKRIYLSSSYDIKGTSQSTDVILKVLRSSDDKFVCAKTLTKSSLITKYTLEPFSEVFMDSAELLNDTLKLVVESAMHGVHIPDIVITVLWEVTHNV